ncbi:uncharacterized protein [Rutidosis leptorrhynchoides]|uniref:uncharacterized protein n=1 Tax=Rutidosis leptorrhynchoides TaxID=125765 RepID=UPI003A9917EF
MGFGSEWVKWVEACFRSASISVLVNGSPTKEFSLQRGIRQDLKGVEIGQDKINIPHLQFANDMIFFGNWNKRNASNVHKTLVCYEKVSGLKINMNKIHLNGIGVARVEIDNMANRLACGISSLQLLRDANRSKHDDEQEGVDEDVIPDDDEDDNEITTID